MSWSHVVAAQAATMVAAMMRREYDDEKPHLIIYTCNYCSWSRLYGVYPRGYYGAGLIPSVNFCRPCTQESFAVDRYLGRIYSRQLRKSKQQGA